MKIHFIAIGGSAMHNLAIALKQSGHEVTGSDDEIFEPSRSRLKAHNLLPESQGWHPEAITPDLDIIILGMHARADNPELKRAQELGLKVYSYPQYLYEQCKDKKRVVVGGSHGKTTVTSMIMHALKFYQIEFDYMVGAQLEGFDTMVRLSPTAPIAVFEGDEYLSSPIDLKPKFLWYQPHLAVLTGVAWDHINVFPTLDNYNHQFELFINSIEKGGYLTWYKNDEVLKSIVKKSTLLNNDPYLALENRTDKGQTVVLLDAKKYEVPIFGEHNFQNMSAALNICTKLGMSSNDFLISMRTFKGAARRMETLFMDDNRAVFYDFAHAPSKVKAAVHAVKQQFKSRKLRAILELHTFSSLNKNFLPQYKNALELADEPYVYFNPKVLAHKKLPLITTMEVATTFNIPLENVLVDSDKVKEMITSIKDESNLIIMSSGNFGGVDLKSIAATL